MSGTDDKKPSIKELDVEEVEQLDDDDLEKISGGKGAKKGRKKGGGGEVESTYIVAGSIATDAS